MISFVLVIGREERREGRRMQERVESPQSVQKIICRRLSRAKSFSKKVCVSGPVSRGKKSFFFIHARPKPLDSYVPSSSPPTFTPFRSFSPFQSHASHPSKRRCILFPSSRRAYPSPNPFQSLRRFRSSRRTEPSSGTANDSLRELPPSSSSASLLSPLLRR